MTSSPRPPEARSTFGPGQRVLMLGDSHTVGAYGQRLKSLIAGTGASIKVDAKEGVSANYFNRRVTNEVKDKDVIVISLGANFRPSSPAQIKDQVTDLTARIRATGSQAKIIWVGPPRTSEDMRDGGASLKAFDRAMQSALGNEGTYVSSEGVTRYSGNDGIHYNSGPARAWADAIFAAIA